MTFAIHPERTPDPEVLQWHFSGATNPPGEGVVERLPVDLTNLGVLAVTSVDGALLVRVADAQTWRRRGEDVRRALSELLSGSYSWQVRPLTPSQRDSLNADTDERIAAAAKTVIDEELASLTTSHGGGITLVSVRDGVVTVALAGACQGCPAAAMTLHQRFETALRSRVDGVVRVESTAPESCDSTPKSGVRQLFLGLPHDRNRRRNS